MKYQKKKKKILQCIKTDTHTKTNFFAAFLMQIPPHNLMPETADDVSCKFSIDVLYQVTEVSLSSCFSHSFFFLIMNEYRIFENAFYPPIDTIM